jgi:hypothetical protein
MLKNSDENIGRWMLLLKFHMMKLLFSRSPSHVGVYIALIFITVTDHDMSVIIFHDCGPKGIMKILQIPRNFTRHPTKLVQISLLCKTGNLQRNGTFWRYHIGELTTQKTLATCETETDDIVTTRKTKVTTHDQSDDQWVLKMQ